MGLLALTVALARLHLGAGNLAVSLAIASVKRAWVCWVSMELSEATALLRIAAAIGLVALFLLGSLSTADLGTRRNEPTPWQLPQQLAPVW